MARNAASAAPVGSPELPPDLVEECRVLASRWRLPEVLPHGGRIAEVGALAGMFSRRILEASRPNELVLIDLDFSVLAPDVASDPRIVLRRGYSHDILSGFAEASFDWIYIDADHSYLGVRRDAAAAADKVKPGGYLIFNDFAHIDPLFGVYGVHRAVTEFARERRWPFAFLAYERFGLYDVALRRPE
jgi:SAM-dependent methyltransferase